MKNKQTRVSIPLYGICFIALLLAAYGCATKKNKEANVTAYQDLKQKISGVMVKSIDGKEVALESLWKERRVVIGFLRHFG